MCMRLVPVFMMLSYLSCNTIQQVSAQKACKAPRDLNKQMAGVCESSHAALLRSLHVRTRSTPTFS